MVGSSVPICRSNRGGCFCERVSSGRELFLVAEPLEVLPDPFQPFSDPNGRIHGSGEPNFADSDRKWRPGTGCAIHTVLIFSSLWFAFDRKHVEEEVSAGDSSAEADNSATRCIERNSLGSAGFEVGPQSHQRLTRDEPSTREARSGRPDSRTFVPKW